MANPAPVLFFLGVVSIMAFPYTLFSLVYQGWVIRSWCRWCLVIQAVLWLECIVVFFFSLRIRPGVFPGDAIPAVIGFGIAVCVWFGLRPVLEHHFQFREKDLELRRVYSKPEYIGLRLAGTAKTVMEVFPRELTVGSPSAPVTLCLAIHPECRHCGEAFREMMALMDLPGGKVRGVIRFYVAVENEGHRGKGKNRDWEVARLILAMMLENREEQAISALGEWFSGDIHSRGFYKRWMRRHGGRASALLGEADGLLERHAQWIKAAGIRAAPALFVNDTALIPPMRFKHLKYFLMRKKN